MYLGERVLSKAGIEDGIRDLVTVQLLDGLNGLKAMKIETRIGHIYHKRGAELTQSYRGDPHRPTRR
jgi:hypothetical protein